MKQKIRNPKFAIHRVDRKARLVKIFRGQGRTPGHLHGYWQEYKGEESEIRNWKSEMTDIAIHVENLSKLYRIGPRERYKALRDILTNAMYAPLRRISPLVLRPSSDGDKRRTENEDYIWALKDVSFEVKRGEVVGIIGRNGAGKSTLLKILSRITEPTEGHAEIHGRVGSLLEVGTGFHPELTGRENIYLNSAILGMRRAEIERKFDEIVAFSGVEKFIDTPVKRYSSGMYVRLAFAVAAHLEPDILVVDEVLAVGDVEFQKKCLGKLKNVAGEGRTVLFVSHNMAAIRSLCHRAILLDAGKIILNSHTDEVVSRYLSERTVDRAVVSSDALELRMEGVINRQNPNIRFREIAILDENGLPQQSFDSDEEITVSVAFECFRQVQDLRVVIYVVDDNGAPLLATQNLDDSHVVANYHKLSLGVYKAVCTFQPNTFGARRFFLDVHLEYPKSEHLVVQRILGFDVRFAPYNGVVYGTNANVHFRPLLKWRIQPLYAEQEQKYVSR